MVKGAIPFALILTMPRGSQPFSTVCIQNSVISVVFLSSLILNAIMPKILRNRLRRIDDMIKHNVNHPSLFDSLLVEYQKKEAEFHGDHKSSHLNSNQSEISSKMQSKKE